MKLSRLRPDVARKARKRKEAKQRNVAYWTFNIRDTIPSAKGGMFARAFGPLRPIQTANFFANCLQPIGTPAKGGYLA